MLLYVHCILPRSIHTNNIKDAAVAVAAALNITEPSSTGIGGDMFCLYYDAKTKKISSLNGSGRYAGNASIEKVRSDLNIAPENQGGFIPMSSALAVTVPGAAAGWVDTVERFGSGKLSLEEILKPAIELGEEGFPVSELASTFVSFFPCSWLFNWMKIDWETVARKRESAPQCIAELPGNAEDRSQRQRRC